MNEANLNSTRTCNLSAIFCATHKQMKANHLVAGLLAVLIAVIAGFGATGRFSTFPDSKAGLPSPDGKFIVRSIDYNSDLSNFVGLHRSLFLEQRSSADKVKLCDYLGHVAVAWATDNLVIVNEYFTNRGARMHLVAADGKNPPLVLDKTRLAMLVPDEIGRHLTGNDHVYVEGYRVNGNVLGLRVWGSGALDAKGFRLTCDYDLDKDAVKCSESGAK